VYTGGDDEAADDRISIFLYNCSGANISIRCPVSMKIENEDYYIHEVDINSFSASDSRARICDFSRSTVLEHYLENGSLAITVWMQEDKYGDDDNLNNVVRSQCSSGYSDNIMKTFLDEETSDVAFDLKGAIVVAHKVIIKAQAEDLYVMCEFNNKTTPMLINDMDSEIFQMMLRTLYGGFISPNEWAENSKAILNAASKYGFIQLKTEAEWWYAKSLKLTADNVIDEFLMADGNNWAIVRESAKKFMAEHGDEILESGSFDRLHESKSLLKEVVAAAFQNIKKRKRGIEV
jgi:hypothetical protein